MKSFQLVKSKGKGDSKVLELVTPGLESLGNSSAKLGLLSKVL